MNKKEMTVIKDESDTEIIDKCDLLRQTEKLYLQSAILIIY